VPIHTQQSAAGFIVTDPQLTFTKQNEARLSFRFGQEHFQRQDDGSFTQLDNTFHDLAIYRKSAETAHELFKKGDKFIAEGYVREYDYEFEGQPQHGEEFVAKRIGHDSLRHPYTVDRTRRAPAPGVETGQDAPAADSAAVGAAGPEAPTAEEPEPAKSGRGRKPTARARELATIAPGGHTNTAASDEIPF